MNRKFVTARLCTLVSEVGEKVFQNRHETDCFCLDPFAQRAPQGNDPQVHKDVVKFIENAVRDAIKKTLVERGDDQIHRLAETPLGPLPSFSVSCSPSD